MDVKKLGSLLSGGCKRFNTRNRIMGRVARARLHCSFGPQFHLPGFMFCSHSAHFSKNVRPRHFHEELRYRCCGADCGPTQVLATLTRSTQLVE